MASENAQQASGAQPTSVTLRALASPVRLAVLQFLAVSESATTGECARVAGVAAGSASYHLRQLAAAGLIEQAASTDRRQRCWKLAVAPALRLPRPDSGITPDEFAFRAAAEDRERNIVDEYLSEAASLPVEWRDAAHIQDIVALTVDEFHELNDTLSEVLERYRARTSEAADEDRRLVYVSIRSTPWVRAETVRAAAGKHTSAVARRPPVHGGHPEVEEVKK